jgi:hypothetical protein
MGGINNVLFICMATISISIICSNISINILNNRIGENMYSFIDSNYFYLFMFIVSFIIIWWSGV